MRLCYLLIIFSFPSFCSDAFHPEINEVETPAHIYVRSVHNISIERSWLRLRLEFGDTAVIVFKKAEEDGIYHSHIPEHVFVNFHFTSLRI
jgi:hypothetical protein